MVTETPDDGIGRNQWISYVLMVVGWFILIRSVSSFLRARKTEQVVLASPERGLGSAIIAEDEEPARAV
jgi:TRAP-type C4-dicarboxylate transport system permease small subunit